MDKYHNKHIKDRTTLHQSRKDKSILDYEKTKSIKNNIYLHIIDKNLEDELSQYVVDNGYNVIILDNQVEFDTELLYETHSILLISSELANHNTASKTSSLDIPVITISIEDTIESRIESTRNNGSYYLTQPIDKALLRSTIDKAMIPRSPHIYKILIIDDDDMLASFHEMVLRRACMKTKVIHSPLDSFIAIDEFKPDLILMDLYMPVCSGSELARILRQKEEYSGIPIIFLSTESDLKEQMTAMEFGGDDFLSKPVSPERLVATVSNRARRAIETNIISSDLKVIASELKAKTLDLDHALTTAKSAEALKSRLIATMSHEIRTPINGMLGILDKLIHTELNSEQKDFSEIVISSTESLLSILNDTLDYSRLEAGKMSLENIEFSPVKTMNQVHQLFEETASSKGINLRLEHQINTPTTLYGDPVRLKQVLINLINNAIKFTDHGEITTSVSVKSHDDDQLVLLFKVIDQGIGLTIAQQKSIFDEYSQAEASTNRTYGGTGLGLSICQKISTIMGGEIGVTSTPGNGSTFWFTAVFSELPAHSAPDEIDTKTDTSPIDYSSQQPLALIAEDNDVNQMIITSYLQKHGINSHIANNGEIAVTKMIAGHYDIIFIDCQMPVLDGYQATRMIRNHEESSDGIKIPIIAMTGNALSGDREKCLDAGMDGYLSKPINKQKLAALLEEFLGRPKKT
ncbi:MAG: response regulator [Gammaproteobacteria bacterium]|nr:response regulator [Gammaproteobacteria bacterium]